MLLIVLPIIALLLTLPLAALRRPRWTLAALLGPPLLLWLSLVVLVAIDAANGCSSENCWYGIEYGLPILLVAAAAGSVSWLAGGGLGWLVGRLFRRRKRQSQP